jgi:hypothetical protein
LHRCYFVWEQVRFFSDRFMRCCKPDIFSSANLRNDFDGIRSIEPEMSINFLSLTLYGLTSFRRLTLSLFHEMSQ